MVRAPRISGSDAAKVFEKAGWHFDRQKGSHMIYKKPDEEKHLSIPNHRTLKTGTLNKLIKAAGLNLQEFEELRLE